MRAPLSWIKDYVALPDTLTIDELTDRLTALGLKLEAIHRADITGPLVVGRVLTMDPEPQKNGKTINWCTVDVGDANGTGEPQGIVCGAHNFKPGDLVVVILPGGVLPGDFVISARKTYGHVSAGMICSGRELGISDQRMQECLVKTPCPSWGLMKRSSSSRSTLTAHMRCLCAELPARRPSVSRSPSLIRRFVTRQLAMVRGIQFRSRIPSAARSS